MRASTEIYKLKGFVRTHNFVYVVILDESLCIHLVGFGNKSWAPKATTLIVNNKAQSHHTNKNVSF